MADNTPLESNASRLAASDQVTYSGDSADVQLVRVVGVTGSEGSKVVSEVVNGHPVTTTLKHTDITTAVTDAAIITVSAGTRIVVTRLTVTLDSASTVFPLVRIGFGTANTPTTTGVIASHGGVPAGGGFTIGDGSAPIGIGADNEDLRVTTTGNATGGGLHITVTYYTIAA